MNTRRLRYLRHRFPSDIISHAVWLYHRYCLSFRDVEDLLAERGILENTNRFSIGDAPHISPYLPRTGNAKWISGYEGMASSRCRSASTWSAT
jgi:hypothetical protein